MRYEEERKLIENIIKSEDAIREHGMKRGVKTHRTEK
jgi:hypothetical protein